MSYNRDTESLEVMDDRALKVIQSRDGYRYNSDSFLLADFVVDRIRELKRPPGAIVDLGTGCGILALMMAKSKLFSKVSAFEVQEGLFGLAKRNIELNNLDINLELKDFTLKDPKDNLKYDYVISNPPYKKLGTGNINDNKEKEIARHEVRTDLKKLCNTLNYILNPQGRAFIVFPSYRMSEFIGVFKSFSLEPKTIQMIYHDSQSHSDNFLVEVVQGGKEFLKVLRPNFASNNN